MYVHICIYIVWFETNFTLVFLEHFQREYSIGFSASLHYPYINKMISSEQDYAPFSFPFLASFPVSYSRVFGQIATEKTKRIILPTIMYVLTVLLYCREITVKPHFGQSVIILSVCFRTTPTHLPTGRCEKFGSIISHVGYVERWWFISKWVCAHTYIWIYVVVFDVPQYLKAINVS